MNLHFIDWMILVGLIGFICFTAYGTKQYMRSVADFLSANRCAGKYLLGVADGISGLGAVSIVALFEMNFKAGFTASWWKLMLLPIGVIIASTGWVQYRFRQTRAMTMAQFFELRYSRSFRVFAGIMGFISGIINFGIFPAVGGRFFQYYCGFPTWPVQLAGFEIDLIYGLIMAFLLAVSLVFTFNRRPDRGDGHRFYPGTLRQYCLRPDRHLPALLPLRLANHRRRRHPIRPRRRLLA